MSRLLVVEYPILPPSDNHIREIKWRFAGRKKTAYIGYTKEAEGYLLDFQRWFNTQDDLFLEVQRFLQGHRPGMVYSFEVYLFFPMEKLLSAGWTKKWASDSRPGTKKPHKQGERKAKHPHKTLDSPNRQKLLQDALAHALGIDDKTNWRSCATKAVSATGEPLAVLTLEEGNPADYNIPEEYWP